MALNICSSIRAGDTLSFSDSLSDYPADIWTLTYTLVNGTHLIKFSSTELNDKHSFSVAPETTTTWKAGKYKYQAFVSDGTDRFTVGTGSVEVIADFSIEPTDQRHHVEKVLDALEAMIEGKASLDQQTFTIAGRSLSKYTPGELLTWRDKYRRELVSIKRAERVRAGFKHAGNVRVRF